MAKTTLAIILLLSISVITLYSPTLTEKSPTSHPSPVKNQPIAPTPVVSIVPGNISDATKGPGSRLTYNVTVANSPAINGFNVWVRFDPRVLMANSSSIDYSKNLLGSGTLVQSECVNSVSIAGCSDPLLDLPGVVNLGLVYLGNKTTPAITTGLLYQLTLWVVDPSKEPLDPGATQLQIAKAILANGLIGEHGETYNAFTIDSFFTNRLCPTGTQPNRLCTHPIADFTFTPVRPTIGTVVTFDSAGSRITNPGATLSSYVWNWGEASPCNGAPPHQETLNSTITHVFCQAVTYDVTLLVNDTLGISWAVTKTVQVILIFVDMPVVGLTVAPSTTIPVGTPVHVTATVENNSTLTESPTLNITVGNDQIASAQFANMAPFGSEKSLQGTWDTTGFAVGTYVVEASVAPGAPENITTDNVKTLSVQLTPSTDLPPVAAFTFSPNSPVIGQTIAFDGSASYDPDGTIQSYDWTFGDGTTASGNSSIVYHQYHSTGNYTAILAVLDNAGLLGTARHGIAVQSQPLHDVSIVRIDVYPPKIIVSSQKVAISVELRNDGLRDENVSLTAYANGKAIQTLTGLSVPTCPPSLFCFYPSFEITWITNGVLPGNYTISATVFLPAGEVDPTPSDNSATYGIVRVLPPPVLVVSPDTGIVGTQVTVHGSGFPIPLQPQYQPTEPIFVTFDDMFLGESFSSNGNFTFTFDVIQAQPGLHLVKALDLSTGATAEASFTLQPGPSGSLVVQIRTGTIYFPGDTVVVYIATSFNGVPVGPGNVQLSLILTFSNGSSQTLAVTSLTIGLYKASYTVPATGPIGTYAITAIARMTGQDSSALATFQVQQSWLSSNKNKIVDGAVALAGVLGLVAVVWKKGYLRRKDASSKFFD